MRLELTAPDLRQRQQRVDQLRHPCGRAAHAIQITEPFIVQLLRVLLDQ